ncbi:unnamed protein product [Brassica rapa subsp. narinosa]
MAASSLLSLPNFVISDMDKSAMTTNASLQHLKRLQWFHLDSVEITEITY